jgi:hypothetical protein
VSTVNGRSLFANHGEATRNRTVRDYYYILSIRNPYAACWLANCGLSGALYPTCGTQLAAPRCIGDAADPVLCHAFVVRRLRSRQRINYAYKLILGRDS